MQNVVKKLLERSHNVTFITSTSMGEQETTNYTEILIDPPLDCSNCRRREERFYNNDKSPFISIFELYKFIAFEANYSLSVKNVGDFINQHDLHFDVVINEEFFRDSFTMFGHRFNTPVVTISKQNVYVYVYERLKIVSISIAEFGNSDFFDRQMGHLTPSSHVPYWV